MKYIFQDDFKQQELPLARIKKIMKLDEDVKVCTHLLYVNVFEGFLLNSVTKLLFMIIHTFIYDNTYTCAYMLILPFYK